MSTGRWSEHFAEYEVRYIGHVSFLVITMSKTSGVVEGLCWMVVKVASPKIRHEFSSAI